MTFEDEILENIKKEIQELDPAIKEILKKGMYEGEKKEDGSGIDKIQLDAAKAAAVVVQEYIAHIIGRPVSRTELSSKEGKPLGININFVVDKGDGNQQNS
jgi:DNA replication protein DnaD